MPLDPELLRRATLPTTLLTELDLLPQNTPQREQSVSATQAVA